MGVNELMAEIAGVGRDARRGGYSRHVYDYADFELRDWYIDQALHIGLDVNTDRNGNIWAWWGSPEAGAVVTGSHLDSVPGGGAFDGPLGVASALAAVEILQDKGFTPARPLAVLVFAEEEGGRFGVPCLGSRLLTGALDPDRARNLRDAEGVTLAEAAVKAGHDPKRFGPDPELLSKIGCFVELHVEQGRGLIELDSPIATGSTIIAHGRYRFSFSGQGNHAGATRLGDRHDPMLPAAAVVAAARRAAAAMTDARATVGRLVPTPGGTNVIASTVDLWLDARAAGDGRTAALVDDITEAAFAAAAAEGCELTVTEESYSDDVVFDEPLRQRMDKVLGGVPALPTGAGHDAGILAAHVPSGMLYVRNPTGVSHAPEEHAEAADVASGAAGLARVLEELAG
ncbi:peptidase M20 family protein [Nocardia brasiliensis NBRC 14402]|uniref:allantoate amidohydrolase n=1 Tax=Nocardia brasiliensis TaxID=37326 RepID=UPI0002E4749B|nr:allantoate amidohydrolase [Nocardia brasiliensis]ASF08087.1 allantoate amidohydrolase [Nocardia brasiliensis]GAJ80960.1 peptidase M20 family protein [Nocardia brasiliensis NBRC 14402]SUB54265.1 N-carbamoyl-L-amino acid hydrolase [Nocardia brasiliensis]